MCALSSGVIASRRGVCYVSVFSPDNRLPWWSGSFALRPEQPVCLAVAGAALVSERGKRRASGQFVPAGENEVQRA